LPARQSSGAEENASDAPATAASRRVFAAAAASKPSLGERIHEHVGTVVYDDIDQDPLLREEVPKFVIAPAG
jgi:hypothetical protein